MFSGIQTVYRAVSNAYNAQTATGGGGGTPHASAGDSQAPKALAGLKTPITFRAVGPPQQQRSPSPPRVSSPQTAGLYPAHVAGPTKTTVSFKAHVHVPTKNVWTQEERDNMGDVSAALARFAQAQNLNDSIIVRFVGLVPLVKFDLVKPESMACMKIESVEDVAKAIIFFTPPKVFHALHATDVQSLINGLHAELTKRTGHDGSNDEIFEHETIAAFVELIIRAAVTPNRPLTDAMFHAIENAMEQHVIFKHNQDRKTGICVDLARTDTYMETFVQFQTLQMDFTIFRPAMRILVEELYNA